MSIENSISDCRFCSVVSKTNGEDPIGTATPFHSCLIIEKKQPWDLKEFFHELKFDPMKLLLQHQILLRVIAIAPDKEYSEPNYTRIVYYFRDSKSLIRFKKQEFIIPDKEVNTFIIALFKNLKKESNQLEEFNKYLQPENQIRDLLVCTHGNVDVACSRFGYPIYQQLRSDYGAASEGKLRVWRCSHFGGHRFAPTLLDLPDGRFWGHLEPEILDVLVNQSGSVSQLRPFYRGWAGLSKFVQIAEAEIWIKEGWEWLTYEKIGEIVNTDESSMKEFLDEYNHLFPSGDIPVSLKNFIQEVNWVELRINFASPDGKISGSYEAKVEANGEVISASTSGKELELKSMKQYCVTSLVKK